MKLWEYTRSRGEFMPLQVLLVVTLLPVLHYTTQLNYQWLWATLGVVAFFNICLIEAFAHRFCTHGAYQLSKPVEWLLAVLTSVVPGTGSTMGWAMIHAAHHQYSDTEKDPHSAQYSKFWELLVWRYPYTGTLHSVRYLARDPIHKSLHQYYVLWMLGWACLWYWLAGINGLMFIVLLPWALGPFLSTVQNYMLHAKAPLNYRSFDTPDHSQNSPSMHLLSFGACGLHNNHHAHPRSWNTVMKKGEVDTAAWFIRLIRKD